MTQSPELAGGTGFTFADQIAARYLASLLASAPGPGTNERRVSRVALEQRAAGEPLDDIIVDATAPDGSIQRLSLQAKRKLTISAAASNTDFRSIIRDCWATLDKPDFRTGTDYIGAAVGASTAVGTARDLQAVAEFARASATASDFARRFAKGGSASAAHATVLGYVEKITREIGREASIEELYRLLSHFILIRFDTLHAGATDDPATVSLIDQALEPGQDAQASLLFDRLQTLIRRGAGTARSWSTQTVRREVAPWFRLATNRSLAPDVEKLAAEARQAAESIADRIGDAAITRPALLQKLNETLAKHSLVTIRGLPGSGKSVLLRHAVDEALSNGPAILLKADRLTGSSWGQYASALHVTNSDLGALLGEIAVVGTATLFIDGLDRIDKAQRGIVIDLLNMIERSPELSEWRILATLRDSGVEPVRTWLPQLFDGGRMATIQVDGLDEDEAQSLAAARPHLKSLLFGGDPVKTLVRRPFFAKILDQAGTLSGGIPRSEVELMAGWWARGGFDAEGGDILLRQRALLRLVRLRALQPDTPVSVDTFDSPLLPVVHSLIVDGILEDAGGGHFVRFAHDIFFEWSFAQLLASAGNSWIGELKSAGEPPVIGRAVDLHAQAMFVADQSSWAQNLAPLSDQGLRSQWRRTWLLAPLNHPEFQRKAAAYQATVSADDFALLRMALVWFQAQHTVPNAGVLDGSLGDIKDRSDRLRVADRLGWPDDFWLWMRFLHFIDTRLTTIPRRLYPHVLTLFEVWQNAMADIANPISAMIVANASDWLSELENRRETRTRLRIPAEKEAPDPWGDVEDREEFEYALRRLLLRASRTEPDRVRTYLSSFTKERPVGSKTFDDILNFAPLLSQTHAADLVDFALGHFLRELPEDHRARRLEEDRRAAAYRKELRNKPEEELNWSEQMSLSSPSLGYWGPDQWDWEALALERDPGRYFPASPLYQPFSALFDAAPDEALRLIKAMTNHAVEAWRQLHRLQPGRGTPVPIAIAFPWGEQTFWGGVREYLWSRGLWAPKPLASAYLALDRWALDQMTRGTDTDALIERIVAGNDSIAALGTALNVAQTRPAVSAVSEALISHQRLWRADIERCAQEFSIKTSSQIGFHREDQRDSALAVDALNTLDIRAEDLRSIATRHVLQNDAAAAMRARKTIQGFADAPDFEFEELRDQPGAREYANEQARTFAAWGSLEHYRLVDLPDQPDRKAIVMVNPIIDEPLVRTRLEEGQQHLRTFGLFHWAQKSFESGALHESMTADQAMDTARSLDSPALFEPGSGLDNVSLRRGAVAGAAAALIAFAPMQGADWATGIVTRAAAAREEKDPYWSSVGIVSWHHSIFVARAAAALLRRDPANRSHVATLFTGLAHPLDCVGLETAKAIASLWDIAPQISWAGLGLALELCIVAPDAVGEDMMHDPDGGHEERQRKLEAALAALESGPAPLPIPPVPWVRIESPAARGRTHDATDDDEDWRLADGWWRSDRAGEILRAQPLQTILVQGYEQPFVDYCRTMLAWTIERKAPSWATRSSDVERSDVFEWTHRFAGLIGGLIGLIDPQTAEDDFLAPICAVTAEDPCFDLLEPLVTMFLCQHMLDVREVASVTPVVLRRALDRFLESPTFSRGGYRSGEIYGTSMPDLARWLMFVGFGEAALSCRFANGDWSDINLILPTVGRFVREAGWAPTILQNYLTLTERAGEHFPAEEFADAILATLSSMPDPGSRWRGTQIAARIGARVQVFADQAAPLELALGQKFLRILDILVDQGDRRSAALQISPAFRDLRLPATTAVASGAS